MIEVKDLGKTYERRRKSVEALRGLSFQVPAGSVFGLIGPNGAGKTTTLRILATLLRPDRGSVVVNGQDTVREAREVRNQIGFLTGEMKLSGNLSPRELLRFFGELNHLPPARVSGRIEYLTEYLGMGEFLDRPVAKLSTGMKQKAAIALGNIFYVVCAAVLNSTASFAGILVAFQLMEPGSGMSASLAKTVRERGTYILPIHLVVGVASMQMDPSRDLGFFLILLAQADWTHIAITLAVNIAAAGVLMRLVAGLYNSERILDTV